MGVEDEMDAATQWNPRFVAFAIAHGKTPEQAREECRASNFADYLIWNGRHIDAWKKLTGEQHLVTLDQHDAYDRWLMEQALIEAEQVNGGAS